MFYSRDYLPDQTLRSVIDRYVFCRYDGPLTSSVLPDCGAVLAFVFNGRIGRIGGGPIESLPNIALSGISHKVQRFSSHDHMHLLFVYFKATGLSQFSKIPMSEICQLSIPATEFFNAHELEDTHGLLADADGEVAKVHLLNEFFTSRRILVDPCEVSNWVAGIESRKGLIRVNDYAMELGVSQRMLERRFRQSVGCTVKQYAQIVQVRYAALKLERGESLLDTALISGFYDQAHFNHVFAQASGKTPRQYRQQFTGPLGHL